MCVFGLGREDGKELNVRGGKKFKFTEIRELFEGRNGGINIPASGAYTYRPIGIRDMTNGVGQLDRSMS